jgi:hypothetical protein
LGLVKVGMATSAVTAKPDWEIQAKLGRMPSEMPWAR